jgi:hypothetical protein
MFYRIVCRDISVAECYVGNTCNEVKRRSQHKSRCTNEKDKSHNTYVYKYIRQHGGWDNWELIVHEKLAVNSKYEAKIRERFWVEHYGATLNKQVPTRTIAEYNVGNVENKKKYGAKYYAAHCEETKKLNAAWRLENSAHLKTKHVCTCGGHYTNATHSRHLKTKKHIAAEAAH